jgi:hypothetical protein
MASAVAHSLTRDAVGENAEFLFQRVGILLGQIGLTFLPIPET